MNVKPCTPPCGDEIGSHCDCWLNRAEDCCWCGSGDDSPEADEEYINRGCRGHRRGSISPSSLSDEW